MAPSDGEEGEQQDGEDGFSIGDPPEPKPNGAAEPKRKRRNVAQLVLSDVTLFRGHDGHAYAHVPQQRDRYETMRVQGHAFRLWVRLRAFREHDVPLSPGALAVIADTAETLALNSGDVRRVWRRLASESGRVYWALGGSDPAGERRVVEISESGWRVLLPGDVPVHFLYADDALPLPEPRQDEATLEDLRAFVPVEGEDELILAAAGIMAALRPDAPQGYPMLAVTGESGSGKTFTTRCLHSLLDPSHAMLLGLPRDERDFAALLSSRHVFSCDNVSSIDNERSDLLCRVATGGAHAARQLHTDGEVFIARLKNPVLLNGIPEQLSVRPDFAERVIAIPLRPLREKRSAEDLAAQFEARMPGLLGLLCDGISSALRNLAGTFIKEGPRMLDACRWAEAAAPGLGIEAGRITAAWRSNRQQADRAALELNDVARAVVAFLDELEREKGLSEWKGEPAELYRRLSDIATERVTKSKTWPGNAAGMSTVLRRLAPSIRNVHAIEVAKGKGGSESTRWWSVRRL